MLRYTVIATAMVALFSGVAHGIMPAGSTVEEKTIGEWHAE